MDFTKENKYLCVAYFARMMINGHNISSGSFCELKVS